MMKLKKNRKKKLVSFRRLTIFFSFRLLFPPPPSPTFHPKKAFSGEPVLFSFLSFFFSRAKEQEEHVLFLFASTTTTWGLAKRASSGAEENSFSFLGVVDDDGAHKKN